MTFVFDEFELDTAKMELRRDGAPVAVEPQVFSLLKLLLENADRMVSRDEIIEVVWQGRFISEAAVASRISAARTLLGDDGRKQKYIKTHHGKGFRFVGSVNGGGQAASEQVSPVTGREQPTVLVLPFTQVPPDAQADWLVDGMCDDVIAGLSRFRALRVISRLTSFGLRHLNESALASATAELAPDYIIEGDVRRQGEDWRLRVSIIEGLSQTRIWSERWQFENISLQNLDCVPDQIVAAIEPEVLSAERDRIRDKKATDLTTWESTQKGLWLLWQQKSGAHAEAVTVLQQACQSDPNYPPAHAGLAYALCHAYKEGVLGAEALDRALASAREAVRLDQRDAFSFVALGRAHLARGEYEASIAAYDQAIALNPNHAYGHFGRGYALSLSGRAPDAIGHFETVLELSPHDPQGWSVCVLLCFSNLIMDRAEVALSWAQKSQRMPNAPHWAKAAEAAALKALGREEEAVGALNEALAARPDLNAAFLDRAYPFADRQDFDKLAEFMLGTFVPAQTPDAP